jgi:ribosomal protein S18 acetylase RimI-like enzyme
MTPGPTVSQIRALLETDRPWSVYALGDLAPEHFGSCTWLCGTGSVPALVLVYRGFAPPVLFALGPPEAVMEMLPEIEGEKTLYLHVRPEIVTALRSRYEVQDEKKMWRMLLDPAHFQSHAAGDAVRLGSSDLAAIRRLYADGDAGGESPEFFLPSMLEQGVYLGVWEEGELIAVAGTHLVVPAEGVGAIGNVYTRRDRRRRGLSGRLTGAVAAALLDRGTRTVALNVDQQNATALRVYERLGFKRYCPFVEALAVRR